MIKIISDSTCDLSKELIEKYNISIHPLHIVLDNKEYLDGVDLLPDDIYKWSDENKTTPKTSAPSIDEAISLFKTHLADYSEIICFSISSEMSTTNNVFHLAAEELDATDRIHIIDSRNLSTGVGHLVIEAAIMATTCDNASDIVTYINSLIPRVRSSFVVDTLTYLHRGGRCGSVAAMAGSVLKLHPKIVVENGKMDATKKYRGKIDYVIKTYVTDMEDELMCAKKDRVFITHSGCERAIVDEVYAYLNDLNIFDEIIETRAGGVISSHCGPGTLGVLYIQ